MLEYHRPDHRQLPLLMGDRLAEALLAAVEAVPARARARQVRKAVIDALGRRQLACLALMAGLAARLAQ